MSSIRKPKPRTQLVTGTEDLEYMELPPDDAVHPEPPFDYDNAIDITPSDPSTQGKNMNNQHDEEEFPADEQTSYDEQETLEEEAPQGDDNNDPFADDPYGAQVLRRVHGDYSNLFGEYDGFMRHLEHPAVTPFMRDLLKGKDKALTSIEKMWNRHYKHLSPLQGTEEEPQEEEMMEEDDPQEEVMEDENPQEEMMEEDIPEEEVVADEIEAPEDELEEDPRSEDDVMEADSTREEVPTPEEVVEGMQRGRGEEGEDGQKHLVGYKNLNNTPQPTNYKSLFQPHEKGHLKEAHGFLGELCEAHDFEDIHRMKSYHFHKCLDCILGGMKTLGEDEQDLSGTDPDANMNLDANGQPRTDERDERPRVHPVILSGEHKSNDNVQPNHRDPRQGRDAKVSNQLGDEQGEYFHRNVGDAQAVANYAAHIPRTHGSNRKSIVGDESWLDEERQEHEGDDVRNTLAAVSDYFKCLSCEKAFGEPHRQRAMLHCKALEPYVSDDDEDEEDEIKEDQEEEYEDQENNQGEEISPSDDANEYFEEEDNELAPEDEEEEDFEPGEMGQKGDNPHQRLPRERRIFYSHEDPNRAGRPAETYTEGESHGVDHDTHPGQQSTRGGLGGRAFRPRGLQKQGDIKYRIDVPGAEYDSSVTAHPFTERGQAQRDAAADRLLAEGEKPDRSHAEYRGASNTVAKDKRRVTSRPIKTDKPQPTPTQNTTAHPRSTYNRPGEVDGKAAPKKVVTNWEPDHNDEPDPSGEYLEGGGEADWTSGTRVPRHVSPVRKEPDGYKPFIEPRGRPLFGDHFNIYDVSTNPKTNVVEPHRRPGGPGPQPRNPASLGKKPGKQEGIKSLNELAESQSSRLDALAKMLESLASKLP